MFDPNADENPIRCPKPVRVLAVDGGGIRGVIPAVFLDELERRTDTPVSQLFDLIVGTSTGAIVALGLTAPKTRRHVRTPKYSAHDIIKLYEEGGPEIFSRSIWRRIKSLDGATDEKYPSKGIDTVMKRVFGRTLLRQSIVPTVVASYDIEQRLPFFFKSVRARRNPGRYDYPMRLVARAATAAPTFFEPLQLRTADRSATYALIDGGVFANNPAMSALAEAVKLFNCRPREVLVVSLGTGELNRPLPFDKAKDWGLVQWARNVISVALDGQEDAVDYQMRHLLPPHKGVPLYYRFQMDLTGASDDMDNTSRENIRGLRALARHTIHDQQKEIIALCNQLTDRPKGTFARSAYHPSLRP